MSHKKIRSILVANRGEPLLRAVKTCKSKGMAVCGVYCGDDRYSHAISRCDLSAEISSYLSPDEIINAAKAHKIDAIWPAWGFLSEDASFAQKVCDAGIIWIGPNPKVMELLAHKGEASKAAKAAGLTTIPEVIIKAKQVADHRSPITDYPLIIKPATGGGGQGQVVVRKEEEFKDALEKAFRISESLFKSGEVVVQKLLEDTRHIEFQILCDNCGNVTVLGERDCSIQRRNQKVIEESPSPALSDKLRNETIERLCRFAKEVGYTSAGTVEFLYSEGKLYFLEVNTRLQVEHPVTEETTFVNGKNVDIVGEMIKIAEGRPLQFSQGEIERKGHAIEARIYAEDAANDFRPASGKIRAISLSGGKNVRVDSGFEGGDCEMSSKYDPMIAKMIAFGDDREATISSLQKALSDSVILGLPSNITLCKKIISHNEFAQGSYDTKFIKRNMSELLHNGEDLWAALTLVSVLKYKKNDQKRLLITEGAKRFETETKCVSEERFVTFLNKVPIEAELRKISENIYTLALSSGSIVRAHAYINGSVNHVLVNGSSYFCEVSSFNAGGEEKDRHASPTGGRISSIKVRPNEHFKKGDTLFVVEAMKMETSVKAAANGIVRSILLSADDVVEAFDKVLELELEAYENKATKETRFDTVKNMPKSSSLARIIAEPLALLDNKASKDRFLIIKNYFAGFDIPADSVRVAGRNITDQKNEAATFLTDLITSFEDILKLSSDEHSLSVGNFPDKKIPKATEDILSRVLKFLYGRDVKNCIGVIPFFRKIFENVEVKKERLHELVSFIAVEGGCVNDGLLKALKKLGLFEDILLRFDLKEPPVAAGYLNEYNDFTAQASKIINGPPRNGSLPEPINSWFKGFEIMELPLALKDVRLFRAGKRLISIAMPKMNAPEIRDGEIHAIPFIERAAINAYIALKAGTETGCGPNHVFIVTPEGFTVPWSGDDKKFSLSLKAVKKVSKRVAGFAHGLNISATEVIIDLKNERGEPFRSILEVRHAGSIGVIGRPPYSVNEREIEKENDPERVLNDRQQRLGKLINKDRAKLLFDGGVFEEVPNSFFMVPEGVQVGLNVYKGKIFGRDVLCYAGDYRIQGGALGENEGKKLAASVIVAYLMGVPLIGIHDGAGANIKGSVASLGWAGAYFGAAANTGGFSSHEKFCEWLGGHHNSAYFKKVLTNFGISDFQITDHRPPITHLPLTHIHLNLGAAVGMLVYGASISNLSIMVDHPEVYRVLTGSATVEKAIGEKATNYELGGSVAHAKKSGDIDIVAPSEESAIRSAREVLALLSPGPNINGIARLSTHPQPSIDTSASIIFGRDAILANVDGGFFYETRKELENAGAVITGLARIAGQPVVIAAMATDGGANRSASFKKIGAAISAAQDLKIPLILVTGKTFDMLNEWSSPHDLYQRNEMYRLLNKVDIPRFGIALGAASARLPVLEACDVVTCVKRGDDTEHEERAAGAVAHFVAADVREAFDNIVKAMS
ncbi:MAG: hypothetical protein COV46_07680 [Deltaproteobacteria bacterium CG11_big_fil_rev_8_21_14_0_20_49_13]|nr:MAG: hypothetical protein COV46_07680 [Deltaproteobacteria bacterium CG11_big_fil_rev_8_21_14_0_20_49_13]